MNSRSLRRTALFATCLLVLAPSIALGAGSAARVPGPASASRPPRPVLAFYYTWYHRDTWCRCQMSDLPATLYDSSDVATIDQQIEQAAQAGISAFITSWPGPGNTQNANLTTFNEWFEGSMIEPSAQYRSLYLTLTRQLSGQWRRQRS